MKSWLSPIERYLMSISSPILWNWIITISPYMPYLCPYYSSPISNSISMALVSWKNCSLSRPPVARGPHDRSSCPETPSRCDTGNTGNVAGPGGGERTQQKSWGLHGFMCFYMVLHGSYGIVHQSNRVCNIVVTICDAWVATTFHRWHSYPLVN